MGTSVDIEYYGIFLGGIKVDGLDQAVEVVVLAVGTLDGAQFNGAVVEFCRGVIGPEEFLGFLAVSLDKVDYARGGQG